MNYIAFANRGKGSVTEILPYKEQLVSGVIVHLSNFEDAQLSLRSDIVIELEVGDGGDGEQAEEDQLAQGRTVQPAVASHCQQLIGPRKSQELVRHWNSKQLCMPICRG